MYFCLMKNIFLTFNLSLLLLLISCDLSKEGGVRVGNNMEAYALKYLENNDILETDEKILILFREETKLGEYDVLYEKWFLSGIAAESIIFDNLQT